MAKRGRPASFDRDEALQRAMELFWARGYEGATLEDLQTAMGGLTPPSFYNAFGSKEALFKEVADLYIATECMPPLRALEEAETARAGIEAMLRQAVESFTQPGKPQGCLLLHGATKCTPANKGPQEYLLAVRQRSPEAISERLRRAVAEGDVPQNVDIDGITAFYATVAQGLAIRAGDGASRAHLTAAVDGAMAAWPEMAKRQRAFGQKRRGSHSRTRR
ncbi:TetR/AcrR family transcriptional regulator [Bradyrhizobium sp. RDT46]|uniref:TetR/AcrR family transcriptional regulator n=1 Tax=Bradyrhizobium sp. RDT46 TaxID=3341829 RepID=UPI0035C6D415